jgi:undecaprenyl-diphosphatase
VRKRKGSAVFFGRFTAALRVLVPGLAGISGVHYPSFLLYNVLGGMLWGTGFAFVGYIAGASYKQAEKYAGRVGLVLLLLIVLVLIFTRVLRRLRKHAPDVRSMGDQVASMPPIAWVRRRFPRQVAWMRARVDPTNPRGFALSFAVAVGATAAWIFGGVTQDILYHDDTALLDPRVLNWILAHRTDWATNVMRSVTWLGSAVLIVPVLLVVGGVYLLRRGDWRPLGLLMAAIAGAVVLYNLVRIFVHRARPPSAAWIGHYSGYSFPSGHATQTVAAYGMLALILGSGRSGRTKVLLWSAVGLVSLLVAASRIYLGAHWLTDVLGGYALGAAWLSVLTALALLVGRPMRDDSSKTEQAPDPSSRADRRRAA